MLRHYSEIKTPPLGLAAAVELVVGRDLRFFFDLGFYFGGYVAENFYGDGIFAKGADGFLELDLALIDLEALGGERIGDIGGGDGAEELIVLASLARETDGHTAEGRGLLLRGIHLRGRFLGQRGANALDGFHVAGGSLDGELARQQEIARVSGLYGDNVAAVAELIDVFLKDDLHFASLCSCR